MKTLLLPRPLTPLTLTYLHKSRPLLSYACGCCCLTCWRLVSSVAASASDPRWPKATAAARAWVFVVTTGGHHTLFHKFIRNLVLGVPRYNAIMKIIFCPRARGAPAARRGRYYTTVYKAEPAH